MICCKGLDAVFDLGYAQTAAVLGSPYEQWRSNGWDDMMGPSILVATIKAWLTTDAKLMGTAQPQPGKPNWYGAFDRVGVNSGDYLIGRYGTFFVSSLAYPAPPSLVWCNHKVSIARANDVIQAGSTGTYSGSAVNDAKPFMVNWAAGIYNGGSRMSPTAMSLPSDAKLPSMLILLPVTAPPIRFNDIITDETGTRYTASATELSPLGWRITAEQWPSA